MTDKILMSKSLKNPNFLGSHDLVIGVENEQPVYGEMTLTVKDILMQEVNDMELIKTGKKNEKGKQTKEAYCMYFQENVKPYIVKAAKVIQAIERATGTKVVNAWIGKRITFYVETGVYTPGTKREDDITTDALRVRPFAPKARATYECTDCHRKDVLEKVAVRSQKAFGVILCAECGVKRMDRQADLCGEQEKRKEQEETNA